MKTVVMINGGNVGSTGRIMSGIAALAESEGYKVYQAYPKSRNILPERKNDIIISSVAVKFLSTRAACYTGLNGCFAWLSTFFFLRKLDRIKPDIIHFHNLHDSYINLSMLFSYVKKNNIRIIWTLHDCWSFTGHCPHFVFIGCNKWKSGCGYCPQMNVYPSIKIDTTRWLWRKKKEWFTGVEDLTIVTPSKWLANLAGESFLGNYPIKIINNGIDFKIFKPTESKFKENHGLSGKKLLLGIAYNWNERKGLDIFVELAKELPEGYSIVLVGTTEEIEKQLPNSIISIHKTNTQKELAEIYTAADVFVNPTREEVLGLVNIEALACGTPVITFNSGGSPETIDSTCGSVVPVDDRKVLLQEIIRICKDQPYSKEACIRRAKFFDRDACFKDYIRLYDEKHT